MVKRYKNQIPMKNLFLFILPIMALNLNSCTKDEGRDDNGNNSGKLVKTISNGDHELYEFFYDSEKKDF